MGMDDPHSYTLDKIDALRRADGEPSWETVMNMNAPTLGKFRPGPYTAHLNTDTTPVVMTGIEPRRLVTEVDGQHRVEVERKGPSYLHSVNSTMAVAIAYLPFLPWWIIVSLVLLAFVCIWCGIKMVKKLAEMRRMKVDYQPVRRSLAAPRNSNMESRYLDSPMPDVSDREDVYEEELEE